MSERYTPRPDMEQLPAAETKRVVFVDASEQNKARARDIAEDRLLREREGKEKEIDDQDKARWRKSVSKALLNFKFSRAYEVKRQKEISKVLKEMEEQQSWFIDVPHADPKATQAELETTVSRFVKGTEDLVHEGEKQHTLEKAFEGKNEHAAKQIKQALKKAIDAYAKGDITTREAFEEEKNRRLDEIKTIADIPPELMKKGLGYGDNLFETAESAKAAFAHHQSLEVLDFDFDVVIAQARTGVRTEAELNWVDRKIDRLKSIPGFRHIDADTLAVGVALAYSAGSFLFQTVARKAGFALGATVGSGVVGAAYAAGRESKRLKQERALHARERAGGKQMEDGKPRRQEMEQYIHETRSAQELTNDLEKVLAVHESGKDLTAEQVHELFDQVVDVDARIRMSDRHNLDLISFSKVTDVERERLQLQIMHAKAKVALRKLHAAGKAHDLAEGKDFDTYCKDVTEVELGAVNNEIKQKDKQFNSFRRGKATKAALKAGLIGIGVGATMGTILQEARSLLHPGETGVFEGVVQGKKVEYATTPIEYFRRWMKGETMTAGGAEHGAVSYGVGQAGTEIPPVMIDKEELVKVGPDAYLQKHPELFSKVHRTLWYDNDTPKPTFDKNELKLWWGGEKNTGVDTNGNYVFNIDHMTQKGSYHGKFSVDAQQALKSGKIRLLLSMSESTQAQPIEVQVDANGNAIIPKDSQIAKLLFETKNGKAVFKGRYAEVAEVVGTKDGVDQVKLLATHEGKGVKEVEDILKVPQPQTVQPGTPGDSPGIDDQPYGIPIYPPPIIPIHSRREMESLGKKEVQDRKQLGPAPERRQLSGRNFDSQKQIDRQSPVKGELKAGVYTGTSGEVSERRLNSTSLPLVYEAGFAHLLLEGSSHEKKRAQELVDQVVSVINSLSEAEREQYLSGLQEISFGTEDYVDTDGLTIGIPVFDEIDNKPFVRELTAGTVESMIRGNLRAAYRLREETGQTQTETPGAEDVKTPDQQTENEPQKQNKEIESELSSSELFKENREFRKYTPDNYRNVVNYLQETLGVTLVSPQNEDKIFSDFDPEERYEILRNLALAVRTIDRSQLNIYVQGLDRVVLGTKIKTGWKGTTVGIPTAVKRGRSWVPARHQPKQWHDILMTALQRAYNERQRASAIEVNELDGTMDSEESDSETQVRELILQYPTLRITSGFESLQELDKMQALKNLKAVLSEFRDGLPSNIIVDLGKEFRVETGKVSLNMVLGTDQYNGKRRLSQQLHAGLRRAEPGRQQRVEKTLVDRKNRAEQRKQELTSNDAEQETVSLEFVDSLAVKANQIIAEIRKNHLNDPVYQKELIILQPLVKTVKKYLKQAKKGKFKEENLSEWEKTITSLNAYVEKNEYLLEG